MRRSGSYLELLRGLREERLRLDDLWCDLADVAELRAAGLVQLNHADESLSLTEAGRSMIAGQTTKSSAARRPAAGRFGSAVSRAPGSPEPATGGFRAE